MLKRLRKKKMTDWYIAIIDFGMGCYPFYGADSKFYEDFKKNAKNTKIVAEAFNVPGEVVDRISEEGLVRKIADRIENGEEFDTQKELENVLSDSKN